MSKILLGVGPTKINKDALREFRGDIELCRTDFSRNLVKNQVQKLNYFFGENRYSFAIPGSGSVLTREGTPVDTGLEVHGSTHDDGTADNHGEGTGELTAAALHTVLDGKAKVHKAEDDENAAEGGHTIREKVFHVFQHG